MNQKLNQNLILNQNLGNENTSQNPNQFMYNFILQNGVNFYSQNGSSNNILNSNILNVLTKLVERLDKKGEKTNKNKKTLSKNINLCKKQNFKNKNLNKKFLKPKNSCVSNKSSSLLSQKKLLISQNKKVKNKKGNFLDKKEKKSKKIVKQKKFNLNKEIKNKPSPYRIKDFIPKNNSPKINSLLSKSKGGYKSTVKKLNVKDKLSTARAKRKKWFNTVDYMLKVNKNPITNTEKRIIRIRNKFLVKHKINRIPNPVNTHKIIYAAYNKNVQNSKVYIGKTKNNLLDRFKKERTLKGKNQNNKLIKFIKRIGMENFSAIPLQQVTNFNKSHFYERYWINTFNTQITRKNPNGLNTHPEHKPFKTRNKKKINKNNKLQRSQFKKQKNQKNQNQNKQKKKKPKRIYKTRKYAHRLITLAQRLYSKNKNPSNNKKIMKRPYVTIIPKISKKEMLESYSLKTLSKFISVIFNKNISKNNLVIYNKITKNHKFEKIISNKTIKRQNKILNKFINKNTVQKLKFILLKQINLRKINKTAKNFGFQKKEILSITYHNSISKFINFRSIFNNANNALPFPLNSTVDIGNVTKGQPPTRTLFFNGKNELENLNDKKLKKTKKIKCFCHEKRFQKYLDDKGHINTCDPKVINEFKNISEKNKKQLIKILKKGTKYIHKNNPNKNQFVRDLKYDLQRAKQKIINKYRFTNKTILDNWQNYVLEETTNELNNLWNEKWFEKTNIHHKFNFPTKEHKQIIRNILHSHLIIYNTDKMPNNYRFTCKKYYLITTNNHIDEKNFIDPTNKKVSNLIPTQPKKTNYKKMKNNETYIVKKQKKFLKKVKFNSFNKLPRVATLFKAHKPGHRLLATAPKVTTTKLAKALHQILTLVKDKLQEKNNNNKNVNEFFLVDTSTNLNKKINLLNRNPNHKPKCIQTSDIVGFYDNIPIKKASKIINNLLKKTLGNYKYVVFNPKTKRIRAVNTLTVPFKNSYEIWEINKIYKLITWRLNNAYIKFNGNVYKQIKGIPMGDNASPIIADLLLYHYESKFMEKLKNLKKTKLIKYFNNTFRKMDDVLSINNPKFQKYVYKENGKLGIYPKKYFTLTFDPQGNEAHFLDLNIKKVKTPKNYKKQKNVEKYAKKISKLNIFELKKKCNKLEIPQTGKKIELIEKIKNKKFNNPTIITTEFAWDTINWTKTENFPVKPIRFPHRDCNLPQHMKIGSYIGTLYTYINTNLLSEHNFLKKSTQLIKYLVEVNKYNISILIYKLIYFLKKEKYRYNIKTKNIIDLFINKFMNKI